MDETLRLWGENIRRRREALKLSQDQLAEMVGVRGPTVWRWEKGQMEPRRHHKALLAGALRQDVLALFPLTRSVA
jgi:transcriptional regulator with XRE-family HTH domain